ncbi:transporter substrate-binding domain-containing protein [Collinsella tanakaei]|uniref:transporter substrate-binding domain-containing protein n=1 Tax=Collinsella tanakaei TaxID=626935 RepID=UPI0025A49635|nr:transporter substrate-binding domain-containing protein [Collinsella tanakaei]MDM8302829.1 transporter substrate-binding domain-containing protein [Collinsella tanakaei]
MQAISRRQFGAVTVAGIAALVGLAGCTDAGGSAGRTGTASSAASSDTLRVGVRADIVGFGYLNEKTGKYYGLEIDIANELANRLGYKNVEFTTVLPDNRKELLLEGEVDALVACYSIADARLESFDFSPAYYDDKVIAVVQNSSLFETIDDLKGCTFGTMSGANAAPLLSIKLYEIGFSDGEVRSANEDNSDVQFDHWRLVQYPSYQELSDALEEGEIDAMVLDGAIAQTYMNDERHILDDFVVEEQSFGVATQKGSELSPKVADAIQGMLDDGTIDTLIDKWN